ncbi:MAG: sporulation integral membrane protein YtvI [Oscillospiraceae bacterium]|nr:sporulation integral membrane protein YtvI [Oscillospiraceae bacterium]
MTPQKKVEFLINSLYLAWVALLLYLAARYLLLWTLPFFLGLCISSALRPAVTWICRYSSARRNFWSVMVLFLLYALLGCLLWWAGVALVLGLQKLIPAASDYCLRVLIPFLNSAGERLSDLLFRGSPAFRGEYAAFLSSLQSRAGDFAAALSQKALDWAGDFASRLPLYGMTCLFTILSSFFISRDYPRIVSFLLRLLPLKARHVLFGLRHFLAGTLLRLLRAYFLILLVTFAELLTGFFLLRIPHPLALAAIVAAADLLPLVGTGIILVPWGLMELLSARPALGAGLLILYGVIALVRSVMEPRIVGGQIGLHPLATLTAIYLGARTMGVGGMLAMPVIFLLAQYLYGEKGAFSRGQPPPPEKGS